MSLRTVGELITALRFLQRDLPLRVFLGPELRNEIGAGIVLKTTPIYIEEDGIPGIGNAAALIIDRNSPMSGMPGSSDDNERSTT